MRYKMIFSYLGTNYYGYQIQHNKKTIQEEIENVLKKIWNEDVKIYASGRTDKGVHASNQVAIFDIDKNLDTFKVRHSINSLLPNDIFIKELTICDNNFHARFSAIGKKYIYRMSCLENNPLKNMCVYYANKNYDAQLVSEAMKLFVGEHNFQNFCTNKDALSYKETIYAFDLNISSDEWVFTIIGSGFKRYMVRMIIATVLAYSEHKISLDEIKEKLTMSKRDNVSFKLPPQGLTLEEVYYSKENIKYDKA